MVVDDNNDEDDKHYIHIANEGDNDDIGINDRTDIDMMKLWMIPVEAATGGRSGVSVYKAGRSVPLESAQLDLSRFALARLGWAGGEKCFKIRLPSSGLKTQKDRKTSKNAFHK